jgi:preprotein translocase subunit SecA
VSSRATRLLPGSREEFSMLTAIGKAIFGTHSDRYIKTLRSTLQRVNDLEKTVEAMDNATLAASTGRFRERLANGEPLDDILPEAFATVREASKRTLGMRPFDVQILGGLVLHSGKIAEMKTGEGKTLVATLPLYTNALEGKGVHLVTVNDYLARRDADWMGQVYSFLGMSVGVVVTNMDEGERIAAYRSDITYGQNNEFGFDYLRDNMKFSVSEFAQRELHYAIVDEVDSILVDEARTPLIISGPADDSTDKYYTINRIIPRLTAVEHFTIDEKARAASLTDDGVARVEEILAIPNLYDPTQIEILHHVHQALKAHALFRRDVDYMVTEEGKVVIVDEFTGRLMPGRRWSDGLHQAVEAKEGCTIERENQTLATITFQNYFRMYNKLAGMTGTAETEAEEFRKIYNLDVIVMPTHRPLVRDDMADLVYKTEREKFEAVIEDLRDCNERGQPVLVGTISIAKSETLSTLLKEAGVKHNVLNAKHHAREAEIVAQAGRKGALTISTNMAGRGTDIVLGGNPEFLARAELGEAWRDHPEWDSTVARFRQQCLDEREEVLKAGGLKIVGTERHESRRIDNQLRGRSGRQGDPGASRFYMSLEDDLLRIFGAERIQGLMERLGMEEGVPIEARMVNRAIENAQRKVEGHNFDLRKHLLEYDDVMNKQREIVYSRRKTYLQGEDLRDEVLAMATGACDGLIEAHTNTERRNPERDWKAIDDALHAQFRIHIPVPEEERDGMEPEAIEERIHEAVREAYEAREESFTPDVTRHLERVITLQGLDAHWKDHLLAMDHLKDGIGLRGYGQRNPLQEYQREGYDLFTEMLARFEVDVVEKMYSVQIAAEQDVERMEEMRRRRHQQMMAAHSASRRVEEAPVTVKRDADKIGRNDPCHCGSGKKYKKCHGTA